MNAQWRTQHGTLRRRERQGWEQLQSALKKVERTEATQKQNQRLRDALERRSAEVVHCGRRCAELELMVEHLRGALSKAMSGLQPEALAALA